MYAETRWLQRFQNFQRALYHLDAAIAKGLENLNPLEVQGLIKGFELTYELAWKTLQDYLYEIGYALGIARKIQASYYRLFDGFDKIMTAIKNKQSS